MIDTVVAALLPIVVTLGLGYFAGWHHDFNASQGGVLNRMVMLYALPLTLFAGMMGIERAQLLAQGPMAALLAICMTASYALVFVLARKVFRRDIKTAALLALAVSGPAAPFVGMPVLGELYGGISAVPVALCGLVMNLVQVPATLFVLSRDANEDENEPQDTPVDMFNKTLREPIVWAPVLAFVLLILDVRLPGQIRTSLQLLGSATGGVALFASGVILFSYRISLSRTVAWAVVVRNVVIPAVALAIGLWMGMETDALRMSVITLAIPTASICVILAVQYHVAEQEMASILGVSTLLSVVTMAAFLLAPA